MNKKIKKVLLVYKKSAYSIYFLERNIKLGRGEKSNLKKEINRFKKAHDEHYSTLREIERILGQYNINYSKYSRGGKINYARFDFIVTVGGDGTFLEAARNVKEQVIIGINSSPSFSVGKLCFGNAKNFEKVIRRLKENKITLSLWPRLRLDLDGHARSIDCVNDCLIAHKNPAAMSRYYLKINGVKEEQRNSGLWIASAAGSSGAIKSAGGKALNPHNKSMQYMPRELYDGFSRKYKHQGRVLHDRPKLFVTSLMRNGMIFVDGTHFQLKFPFNSTLHVSLSPKPIKTVKLD